MTTKARIQGMKKVRSLVENYFYNLIKTISGVVYPIVTFAYASRVLGEEGIGKVNFARSVVTYFVMLALLGMNEYGTRECARIRDDRDALSKFSHEMLMINTCTTLLSYSLFFFALIFVPKLQIYKSLLLLNSLAIILKGMGVEWLYQGLEEYRYIAVRSILFQLAAVAVLFIFVRDANDVLAYAFVLLLATSGSYVFNFINIRNLISFKWYGSYGIKKHLKSLLWLFAVAVSIELYTVLDTTMLGLIQNDAAVGRYTAAIKINKLVITIITAIGAVMIPRLSYYIRYGEKEKVSSLVEKLYNYVLMFSVPASIGLCALSRDIIHLFSGAGFTSAELTMQILTPIVLIIPLSVVTNVQTFVPMGKEKLILLSTMTGAIVNFTCNLILIPRFSENGAAIATVIAEAMVTIVSLICADKFYNLRKIFKDVYQYLIAAMPIPLIIILFNKMASCYVLRMATVILLSAICYFAILWRFKNRYLNDVIKTVTNRKKVYHDFSKL